MLEDHSFSMPVGRIEYLHLGPMTFEEYLMAAGKEKRLYALQNFTVSMTDVHNAGDIMRINSGAVCEQFIGQQLMFTKKYYEYPQLYCWMRQKHNTSAEVDFLIQAGINIVLIEVKAGKTGTLKSLHVFICEKKCDFAIRFNADIPSVLDLQTSVTGKPTHDFRLLSLPLYLVGQTQRLCREAITQKSSNIEL